MRTAVMTVGFRKGEMMAFAMDGLKILIKTVDR